MSDGAADDRDPGERPPPRDRPSAGEQPPAAPGSPARELLELAIRIAAIGGDLLAERFYHDKEQAVGSKSSPTDLVSKADVEVERYIDELLEEERPDDGLLGEEGGLREGSSGLCWVIDPLDGTVNFLLNIPHWCVSVAVRDEDGPVAGAIYDPLRDEMFTATRDGPAVLDGPEKPSLLRPPATVPQREKRTLSVHERAGGLAGAMVATGLAYRAEVRAAQAEVLARLAPRVRDVRRFGSAALDLAWTAAGRYDAYFERSVQRWDVEAGSLICLRAGLRVIDLPPAGELPWGVLAATPALADPLMEIVG